MGQTRSEQDRQATDETSNREVGFQVEHPTDRIVSRTERGHLVDTMPNPNSRTEIGARLVLTRKALDYTQATMAGLMGVDGQTLAAYEAGRRRIPIKQALKLCPYGIPLDWIYQGQRANLHPHIRDKILEQAPQS
jgi:DNA-binding XRE family transcriptional regulator